MQSMNGALEPELGGASVGGVGGGGVQGVHRGPAIDQRVRSDRLRRDQPLLTSTSVSHSFLLFVVFSLVVSSKFRDVRRVFVTWI